MHLLLDHLQLPQATVLVLLHHIPHQPVQVQAHLLVLQLHRVLHLVHQPQHPQVPQLRILLVLRLHILPPLLLVEALQHLLVHPQVTALVLVLLDHRLLLLQEVHHILHLHQHQPALPTVLVHLQVALHQPHLLPLRQLLRVQALVQALLIHPLRQLHILHRLHRRLHLRHLQAVVLVHQLVLHLQEVLLTVPQHL